MTKGMTQAAAPIEHLARRRLWLGLELRPPVAERLEGNPLSLAILSDSTHSGPMPHGALAKKPRRNARDLTASRPPPENLSARTDRVRTSKKQVCEKCWRP